MKILFVGLGSIGQRHLRNLNTLKYNNSKTEIYYFSETNKSLLISQNLQSAKYDNLEKKFKIKKILKKNDIKKIKPDISFICNPSSKHISFSIFLAELGSHIFLEKPLSNCTRNISKLNKIIKSKNLIFYVGYQMKFHPFLIEIKSIIEKKTYGKILSAKINFAEYLEFFHRYEKIQDTIYGKKEFGGGAILEISHEIDYLLWLFGKKPHKIKTSYSKVSNLPIDVEDISFSIFTFIKNHKKVLVNLNIDLLQFNSERNATFIFDNAIIRIDFKTLIFSIFKKNGKKEIKKLKKFKRNDLFISQLKYFFECIKLKKPPLTNNLESAQATLLLALTMKSKANVI
jgi:predicted dehydrogenase